MGREKLKKSVTLFLIFLFIITVNLNVFATELFSKKEYSEEYKKYLQLSDEEKAKVIAPNMFNVSKDMNYYNQDNNFLPIGAATESKYSLKNVIPDNMKVKDQDTTEDCWAFAMIASLETNLALQNYNNKKALKIYDFSERHMDLVNTRTFKNNKINNYGVTRTIGTPGTFNMAIAYLTNGMGAVSEKDVPFSNSRELVDISEIQNKSVQTEVFDTIQFPKYDVTDDLTNIKQEIKEHIKNYGAVGAAIYGASPVTDYYNYENSALYCDNKNNCPINHAVSIVGWDDDFSVDKFNEAHRPTKKGAWIIRNSWGTEIDSNSTLSDWKVAAYNQLKDDENFKKYGYNSPNDIPNEFMMKLFKELNYRYDSSSDKVYIPYGDEGYIYVSYEDVNIYSGIYGIQKASDTVNYDYIYQYNPTGCSDGIILKSSDVFIGNIFNKQGNGVEYLNKVSINVIEDSECSVYVNPNGNSMKKSDLQKVQLISGNSKKVSAGYHTLEFKNGIEINSNEFVVVIEVKTNKDNVTILEETKTSPFYDNVEVENGKCFVGVGNDSSIEWTDMSKISELNSEIGDGDSTIKAFTSKVKANNSSSSGSDSDNKQDNNRSPQPTQSAMSDPTIAKGSLPKAGKEIFVIGILFLAGLTVIIYKRYKNIDK